MPALEERIAEDLRTAISEEEMTLSRLRSSLEALEGAKREMVKTPTRRPRRSRSRSRGSSSRTTTPRRNPTPLTPEMVIEGLRAHGNGGAQASALSKELGYGDGTVLKQLHALLAMGRVSRTGERSATRWAAVPAS